MGFGSAKTCTFAVLLAISALSIGIWWRRKRKNVPKAKLKLFYFPFFRSNRCRWLISEMGIQDDIELIYMDTKDADELKVQAYRDKLHPHGTIPCLQVDNQPPMIESAAICMYLADLYGKLVPEPKNRKDYYNWIVYSCSTVDEMLEILFIQWGETKPEDQDKALISKTLQKVDVFANHFSKFIDGRQYICGDRFTAADCVVGYCIWWASVMKESNLIANFPPIIKYLNNLKKRSKFREIFEID